MDKFLRFVLLGLICGSVFCADYAMALETDFHGRVQSTYVLRDNDGFYHGFMDSMEGVQWRNELKFELTLRPEYEQYHTFTVDKVYLAYRGAYDAIFDCRESEYENVREKSPDDFELGKDDLETENDLREAFVDFKAETDTQSAVLRIGRQIVQWGEADGFNVVNIVNPQDNSVLMFFETPEDLATPLWMARLNYSRGNIGPFRDFGLELLLVPDIRPHQFSALDGDMDAPYAFGFKYLKALPFEHFFGLSVDNFEELLPGLASPLGNDAAIFKEDVPDSGFNNAEYGAKLQISLGQVAHAFHYYHGIQDDPAMDFSQLLSRGTLTFRHPEQDMYGYSFNTFVRSINAIFRGEGCLVDKVALLDLTGVTGIDEGWLSSHGFGSTQDFIESLIGGATNLPISSLEGSKGYVKRKVYYGLLGLDVDRFIRPLNKKCMIHTSWQFYMRHIHDWSWNSRYRPFQEQDNYRLTTYWWTDYWNGRIHPEMFLMYDPEGVWMTMASVKYTKDYRWYYKLTQMSFWGNKDATSDFTQPVDLRPTSEISFRVGYNW